MIKTVMKLKMFSSKLGVLSKKILILNTNFAHEAIRFCEQNFEWVKHEKMMMAMGIALAGLTSLSHADDYGIVDLEK